MSKATPATSPRPVQLIHLALLPNPVVVPLRRDFRRAQSHLLYPGRRLSVASITRTSSGKRSTPARNWRKDGSWLKVHDRLRIGREWITTVKVRQNRLDSHVKAIVRVKRWI